MKQLLSTLFLIFSISMVHGQDSENMTLLDRWEVDTLPLVSGLQFNDIWGYVDCEGTEYAILGSAGRIHFISLADPTNIEEVASFEGGQLSIWRDIKTYKNRAYSVTEATEGLMIFDLSDLPNGVTKTNQTSEHFSKAHNIYIDEENGRLYVVGTDTQSGGIIIFDLTADPDNPTLLASINLPADPVSQTGYVHDIFVKDNIAYASHGYLGFFIWDLSVATQPVLLASRSTGGYNHSSWLSEDGTFAIYAEEVPKGRPLGVMNLENLSNEFIEIDTTFKFPLLQNDLDNTPHNPFIRGNYLICSYYEDGIQVIDITDPMNASRVAYYDTYLTNTTYNGTTGNWGAYPFLPSGIILASDVHTGLYVLELDPSMELANIDAPSIPDVDVTFQGSTELCEGEILTLTATSTTNDISWSWNLGGNQIGDNPVLEVTQTGSYEAIVTNSSGCTNSQIIDVLVSQVPDVEITSQGSTELCEGEILTLTATSTTSDLSWNWTLDGNQLGDNPILNVTESGTYEAIAVNTSGCTNSQTIDVIVSQMPDINITPQGPTEFCLGNTLNLMASSTSNDVTFNWNVNGTQLGDEANLQVTESGIYEMIITNAQGCSNSENIEITVYQPEIPEISLSGNLLTSTPANYFQWYLNGNIIQGANNQNLAVTEVGEYYVGIVDANGCFGNSMVIEVEVVSTNEIKNIRSFSILPNPVNELLQVKLDLEKTDDFEIQILGLDGKLLFEKNNIFQKSDQMEINVSEFSQGIYFIKLKNKEGQLVRKFVKI